MEGNKKLKRLCTEFITLDESDKEYVLGVAQALSFAVQNVTQAVPANRENTKQPVSAGHLVVGELQ